jgi:acetoacetate decarboxylase
VLKGAWSGAARLHLIPHGNAPVADLPVRKVLQGLHFVADITLPYGRVLHDYLAK